MEKQYNYVNPHARYVLWSRIIKYDPRKELFVREFIIQDKENGQKLSKEGFSIDVLVSHILEENFLKIDPTKENITTIINKKPNSAILPINDIELASFFVLHKSNKNYIPSNQQALLV